MKRIVSTYPGKGQKRNSLRGEAEIEDEGQEESSVCI